MAKSTWNGALQWEKPLSMHFEAGKFHYQCTLNNQRMENMDISQVKQRITGRKPRIMWGLMGTSTANHVFFTIFLTPKLEVYCKFSMNPTTWRLDWFPTSGLQKKSFLRCCYSLPDQIGANLNIGPFLPEIMAIYNDFTNWKILRTLFSPLG